MVPGEESNRGICYTERDSTGGNASRCHGDICMSSSGMNSCHWITHAPLTTVLLGECYHAAFTDEALGLRKIINISLRSSHNIGQSWDFKPGVLGGPWDVWILTALGD